MTWTTSHSATSAIDFCNYLSASIKQAFESINFFASTLSPPWLTPTRLTTRLTPGVLWKFLIVKDVEKMNGKQMRKKILKKRRTFENICDLVLKCTIQRQSTSSNILLSGGFELALHLPRQESLEYSTHQGHFEHQIGLLRLPPLSEIVDIKSFQELTAFVTDFKRRDCHNAL